MKALCLGKADFVQLSSDFHFDFETFLTLKKLYCLYTRSIHRERISKIFRYFLKTKDPFGLGDKIPCVGYEDDTNVSDDQLHTFLRSLCDLERALLFPEGVTHREDKDTMAISWVFETRKLTCRRKKRGEKPSPWFIPRYPPVD